MIESGRMNSGKETRAVRIVIATLKGEKLEEVEYALKETPAEKNQDKVKKALAGGEIEPGEPAGETALRKLGEEVQFPNDINAVPHYFSEFVNEDTGLITYVFYVVVAGEIMKAFNALTNLRTFTLEELKGLEIVSDHQEMLDAVIQNTVMHQLIELTRESYKGPSSVPPLDISTV
jgi:ADP-ribose pyrophosphatase YjhB (NUDIX family)